MKAMSSWPGAVVAVLHSGCADVLDAQIPFGSVDCSAGKFIAVIANKRRVAIRNPLTASLSVMKCLYAELDDQIPQRSPGFQVCTYKP
jgi:hypothetical protein